MSEVVKQLTDGDIQQQELEIAVAYCDKMIADGNDFGMFSMIKRSLLSGESKFEDWNNGRLKL